MQFSKINDSTTVAFPGKFAKLSEQHLNPETLTIYIVGWKNNYLKKHGHSYKCHLRKHISSIVTEPAFTCSKLTTETLEQYVQS